MLLAGSKQGLSHPTPPLKGFGADVMQQPACILRCGWRSVDEQFYGVRQIIRFRVGRVAEMYAEMAKIAGTIKIRALQQLFTPTVYQTITVDTALDPKD